MYRSSKQRRRRHLKTHIETIAKLPQELCDAIIDHLYDDKPSLSSCASVCRGWKDSSRRHLFYRIFARYNPEKSDKEVVTNYGHILDIIEKGGSRLTDFIREVHLAPVRWDMPVQSSLRRYEYSLQIPPHSYLNPDFLKVMVDSIPHMHTLILDDIALSGFLPSCRPTLSRSLQRLSVSPGRCNTDEVLKMFSLVPSVADLQLLLYSSSITEPLEYPKHLEDLPLTSLTVEGRNWNHIFETGVPFWPLLSTLSATIHIAQTEAQVKIVGEIMEYSVASLQHLHLTITEVCPSGGSCIYNGLPITFCSNLRSLSVSIYSQQWKGSSPDSRLFWKLKAMEHWTIVLRLLQGVTESENIESVEVQILCTGGGIQHLLKDFSWDELDAALMSFPNLKKVEFCGIHEQECSSERRVKVTLPGAWKAWLKNKLPQTADGNNIHFP